MPNQPNAAAGSIEAILRQTLDDRRLSRAERRGLAEVLAQIDPAAENRERFRAAAFAIARGELIDPGAIAVLEWLEDCVKVLGATPRESNAAEDQAATDACFSPEDNCPERIVGLFNAARKTVDVCVFTITDNRIAGAMVAAHQRGVRIRVLTDDAKSADPGSDIRRLTGVGVAVRMDRDPDHMHHKYAIFDGAIVLTGSYNWTRSAAEHNEENFVVARDRRLVERFERHFDKLWRKWE